MDRTMTDKTVGTQLKWLWLAVLVLAIDLGTKALASTLLAYGQPVPVMPMFNLTLLHNTGAAFSFLAEAAGWQRWFFVVLALLVSVFLIGWLRRLKPRETWTAIAIALILGGALGNVHDRVMHGYVVDFLHFYWRDWHFPAFNLADTAITLGAAMMILDVFRKPAPGGNANRSDKPS
ncbi:signal peptidase II [uncultured Marinobacter sp.]|uniref:signal peptidase II n=1 Tax=uncultured Marinobacter sp. TaxID=187379 RepID=UPI000C098B4F|nr:signal peptidase II [Marinobacter sp.]MBI44023.1 signal peptidase II [Oceanospirillales bacterium]|tara:strand:- start:8632 stop:9162 length:531 start_codon:yes stop_codon:yes gene_type:complete